MIAYEEQVSSEISSGYQRCFSFYDLGVVDESTESVLQWPREHNVLTVIVIRIPSCKADLLISFNYPVASSPDPAITQKELKQVLLIINIVDDVHLEI
jgi:hypothetical protein